MTLLCCASDVVQLGLAQWGPKKSLVTCCWCLSATVKAVFSFIFKWSRGDMRWCNEWEHGPFFWCLFRSPVSHYTHSFDSWTVWWSVDPNPPPFYQILSGLAENWITNNDSWNRWATAIPRIRLRQSIDAQRTRSKWDDDICNYRIQIV